MQKYGLTYSDLDTYPKLIPMINNKNFKPKRIKILQLTQQKAKELPPFKVLVLFPKLVELDISNNRIIRFDPKPITIGCKFLKKLKMNNNMIRSLVDIKKFGDLEHLESLSFINNPVTKNLLYIKILDQLIFPNKNKINDQNEIFTATYTMIPNYLEKYQLPEVDEDNIIYDLEVAKKGIHKFLDNDKGIQRPGNVMRGLKWIFSVIDTKCPHRKIGNFKKLSVLNRSTITIYDIYRITNMRNKFDFITNEIEEKAIKKMKLIERENEKYRRRKGIKPKKVPKSKMNPYYYKKFQRRINRKLDKHEPVLYLSTKNKEYRKEDNYLQVIFKLDKINAQKVRERKEIETGKEIRQWKEEVKDLKGQPQTKIHLNQLKKEFEDMKMEKKLKERKMREGVENYKAYERRTNNLRKFKDPSRFDEYFSELRKEYPMALSEIKTEAQVQEYLKRIHKEENQKKSLEERKIEKQLDAMCKYKKNRERKPVLILTKFKKDILEESDDLENCSQSKLSEDEEEENQKEREKQKIENFRKKFELDFDDKTGVDYLKEVEKIQRKHRLEKIANEMDSNPRNSLALIFNPLTHKLKVGEKINEAGKLFAEYEQNYSHNKKVEEIVKETFGNAFKKFVDGKKEEIDKIAKSSKKKKLTQREKIMERNKASEELRAVFQRREVVPFFKKKRSKKKKGFYGLTVTSSKGGSKLMNFEFSDKSSMVGKTPKQNENHLNSSFNRWATMNPKLDRSLVALGKYTKACFTPNNGNIQNFLKKEEKKKQRVALMLKRDKLKNDNIYEKNEPITGGNTVDNSVLAKNSLFRKNMNKAVKVTENFLEDSEDTTFLYHPRRKRSALVRRNDYSHKRNKSGYLENRKKTIKFKSMKKSYSANNLRPGKPATAFRKTRQEKLVEEKGRMKRAKSLKKLAEKRKINFLVYSRNNDSKQSAKLTKAAFLGANKTFKSKPVKNSFKKNNIVHKDVEYLKPNFDDFKVGEEEILLSEDDEIDYFRIQEVKNWDKKNGNNIKKTREMLQKSSHTLEDYNRIRSTFYIHDTRKELLKQKKKIIDYKEIKMHLKELFPHKKYRSKDIEEFRRIYEDINNLKELPNFNIGKIEKILKNTTVGEERKEELEKYLALVELSKKVKFKDSGNLWQKEVEDEFERKKHEAVLAAHYLKLKNFGKKEIYEKYANRLINSDSTTNYGLECIRHVPKKKIKKEERIMITSPEPSIKEKSKPGLHDLANEEKFLHEKVKVLKRLKLENLRKIPENQEKFELSEEAKTWLPGIQERYEDMIFKPPKKWDFDSALEKAKINKIAQQLDKNGNNREEQLVNYAKNFKAKTDETQKLFKGANKDLERMDKKMNQFYEDCKEMQDLYRNKDKCMRMYVKKVIDGKVLN